MIVFANTDKFTCLFWKIFRVLVSKHFESTAEGMDILGNKTFPSKETQ